MDEDHNTPDAANDAAAAARNLQHDAKDTLNNIKKEGILGFFSFDTLYFPKIARFVFILVCALTIIGMLLAILAGFAAMFQGQFGAGLGSMIAAVVGCALWLLGLRIWFEMMMVAFKINDNLEKLLEK